MSEVAIADIQTKLLEIAVYFDKFCKQNDIVYYLMGGSALGAIRHEGFIPWDDDFDVFMTYENYIKLINASENKLDIDTYFFQRENTKEWPLFFSKLRMNGTTFIEEDTRNRKMHKGIYIDIMCLNNVYTLKPLRYLQYLSARLITAKTLSERGYLTNSLLKKIAMFFLNFIITDYHKTKLINFIRKLNSNETKYIGHLFGRAKFKNTSFPTTYLGKPRYVKFAGVSLPVPEKVEDYLSLRYGKNFMNMPDEKTKSLYPRHAAFVDLFNDYKKYDNSDLVQ